MKLKQIIGVTLMIFMSSSLWNKFKHNLLETDEPLAMGALLGVIMLLLVFLVVKVLRS